MRCDDMTMGAGAGQKLKKEKGNIKRIEESIAVLDVCNDSSVHISLKIY